MIRLENLQDIAIKITQAAQNKSRLIIAIVGAPGAGKSTFSAALHSEFGETAVVVPQDGFHFDNAILSKSGQLEKKGAPETFDTTGLTTLLSQIHNAKQPLYFPIFDRVKDLSRASACAILPAHNIVLVEGNYLLLGQPGWAEMKQYFDLTIGLSVTQDTLRQRLTHRWKKLGLSENDIAAKVDNNDLPNGLLVAESLKQVDITVERWTKPVKNTAQHTNA